MPVQFKLETSTLIPKASGVLHIFRGICQYVSEIRKDLQRFRDVKIKPQFPSFMIGPMKEPELPKPSAPPSDCTDLAAPAGTGLREFLRGF